jgi:hypothetical protein
MTVNFLIRWARKWRTIAASIPSNDKRFDRAIKNLRWINIQLSEMEATQEANWRTTVCGLPSGADRKHRNCQTLKH